MSLEQKIGLVFAVALFIGILTFSALTLASIASDIRAIKEILRRKE